MGYVNSRVIKTIFGIAVAFCILATFHPSFAHIIPFAFWKTQGSGWAWVGGFDTVEHYGNYGAQGTGSTLNHPGVRQNAVTWTDGAGYLWLFGGIGYDSGDFYQSGTYLGDLWKYEIATSKWTFVAGNPIGGQGGVYGTKGVANAANYPGGRDHATAWRDASGNLWLFGGWGNDEVGHGSGYLNDLWKFDTSTSQWTWISGDKWSDQSPTYGTKGTAASANVPGARMNSSKVGYVDSSGYLWLFGGEGHDSTGAVGKLNDLWRFNPTTSQWTWMSGANTADQNPTYGTKGTGSTSNKPGARVSPMLWVDSSSSYVWIMAGHGRDKNSTVDFLNDLWKYEIATGKWTWVSGSDTVDASGTYGTKGTGSTANSPGGMSDSSHTRDASGNFWVYQGQAYDSAGSLGLLNSLWKFDPSNNQWTWVSGANLVNQQDSQSGSYGTKGVGSTANLISSRLLASMWYENSTAKIYLFGGWGYLKSTSTLQSYLNDLWSFDPSNLQWTWVNGPGDANWDNNTGTLGVASATNSPGGRYGALTLRDSSGNLWLFGGRGFSPQGGNGLMGDLWNYNVATSQWTWMSGPAYPEQPGVYGTKGTGSTNNYPGARQLAAGWIDSSDIIWVFGGSGIDGAYNYGLLNDLWKFNPSNSQWTWVAGPSTNGAGGTHGTKGTGSTANIPGSREAMASWKDASGNFWMFSGFGMDGAASPTQGYLSDLWKFNPSNSQWTWVSGSKTANGNPTWGTKGTANTANIPGSRRDASGVVDSSGNFWIFGGYGFYSAGADSNFSDLWKYDPVGGTWTWVSGFNTAFTNGVYGTKGVASTANAPGTRNVSRMLIDSNNKLWVFGGWGHDSTGSDDYLNDFWKYDPTGNTWTWMTGSNVVDQLGTYGTKGNPSSGNSPGARIYEQVWIDSSNNIWLYGGHGYDAYGARGYLYDFWKYKP